MSVTLRRAARAVVATGSAVAVLATAHTVVNLRHLHRPTLEPPEVAEAVSVLLPVRDEAHRVEACLRSVLEQEGVRDLEVLVLDDGSSDGTAEVVRRVAGSDPRVRLLTGAPLPPGWLGKPHACHQLTAHARGEVLVLLDADVVLATFAVASAVMLLRSSGLDLVSPYPRQLTETPAERLVQPLLQWSWLTTLPLRWAQRSPRESLAVANGQLLVVDRRAYEGCGGHAGVRTEVLEDLALLRSLKRSGSSGTVVDGTSLATCRMYDGWPALREGYSKSLWSAFGSRTGATATMTALAVVYLVPPVAALGGSRVGLAGYLAAVTGRYLVAERTGGRSLPDSLAHPLSVTALIWLTARSWRLRRAGGLRWKDRPV